VSRILLAQAPRHHPSWLIVDVSQKGNMPDSYWISEFRRRMSDFAPSPGPDAASVSVKVRVQGGCFHREHSPEAYRLIDSHLQRLLPKDRIRFEEHESGPEILAIVALTTAGIAFTKSVIDLVVAIIKARSDGIRKGDHPREDLELIVRRIDQKGEYAEENILRISSDRTIEAKDIIESLEKHSLTLEAPKPGRRKKKKLG
jgi:hypothetical protein